MFQPGGVQLSILPHSSPLPITYSEVRGTFFNLPIKAVSLLDAIMKHDPIKFICA